MRRAKATTVATMRRATATRNRVDAVGAPPQPGEAGSEPSQFLRVEMPYNSSESLLDLGRVEPSPPPPPPAPARAPEKKGPHDLRANPKVMLAQAKRFATGVLEHYNKKKKIKFELLDAKPVIGIPEPHCCYAHINFTARSSKEDSEEQLFFAELYHCSKRRSPSGFIVTCCEPLGHDSAVGQKFGKPEGTSAVRKNADFTHCFACTNKMLHPRGEHYVAGHCNVPYAYDSMR
ncbi:unnamed protein product [Urochloa decumbens]|uniref:DUF3615 domain-containing protein n=1 Tax=Urochloa decumbens TaxID=240449 RepID=A0ABC9BEP7_9POAL